MPEAIGVDAMSGFTYSGQKLGQSSTSAKTIKTNPS